MCRPTTRWVAWAFLGLLLPTCDGGQAPAPLTPEDIARNNRGVALMGHFDYPAAELAFAEIEPAPNPERPAIEPIPKTWC